MKYWFFVIGVQCNCLLVHANQLGKGHPVRDCQVGLLEFEQQHDLGGKTGGQSLWHLGSDKTRGGIKRE